VDHLLSRRNDAQYESYFSRPGVLTIGQLVGDVRDSAVVIIDDLIASGGTLLGSVAACLEKGADKVYATASHGLFVGAADKLFTGDELEQVIVTDTVPPFRLDHDLVRHKLVVLPASELFADAIRRIHEGGSLVELLNR
jgi:ribose-phosphate pyrophosphokinase